MGCRGRPGDYDRHFGERLAGVDMDVAECRGSFFRSEVADAFKNDEPAKRRQSGPVTGLHDPVARDGCESFLRGI